MDKNRKKLLLAQWRQENKRHLELGREEAEAMLMYVDECIAEQGCDHTLRFTASWMNEHIPHERHEKIYAEIEDMGGYCDCEMVCNCYEDYDIDV
jgi:hypothetical protein